MSEELKPPSFRKTKSGKWAVMAPIVTLEKALAADGKVEVLKKNGDWSSFTVASLGKPFDVEGTEMAYGYGADDEAEGERPAAGSGSAPSRPAAPAPARDDNEPLPEYQGGAEDEWQEF